MLKKLPRKLAALYQLDRASTSIALNIAEGNGKYTPKDRYFDIARGSALESAGALDIIITKEYYPKEQINLGKNMLRSIVSMLVLLIKRTSKDRAP
ncbi:four helix bundle protein [Candidatus Uabimicrobium helgolandensis]